MAQRPRCCSRCTNPGTTPGWHPPPRGCDLVLLRSLRGLGPFAPTATVAIATAALAMEVVLLVVATAPRLLQTPTFVEWFAENPEDTGFTFVMRHPGTVYFPFAPLITLMSEGKAYHFSDGVYQQVLTGVPVTPEQLAAGLPPHLTTVAFRSARDFSARYLPQFSEPASDPELPGWTIRRRPGG